MKKEYVRPMLYAERFTLAEHISAGCANVVHFGADCGPYNINGMMLFNTGCGDEAVEFWNNNDVDPAAATFEDMEAKGVQCYTTFISLSTIFNS